MPKSKHVDGFVSAFEGVISLLDDLINKVQEGKEQFIKLKEELTKPEEEKKTEVKEEPKLPTLEEVRTVLADLSRRGYTTNVRMMLIGLGVSKLSEVDPKDYPELLAKAKELNDATKE